MIDFRSCFFGKLMVEWGEELARIVRLIETVLSLKKFSE